ncbi:dihydrolipoyl dehydrogenase family protein [Microvirga sp. 2TAF3]|uniref:dihydrolipoyl dehydrogenase family protein n=1 Tax=Microvirga sp. 2TAF3 TaxID=3233014 RepID=UPI003F96C939
MNKSNESVSKSEVLKPDLCVIGAGAAGMSAASIAVSLGSSVVLIEKAKLGGECLNVGCVPSKALIAAANRAHALRHAKSFGVGSGEEPEIDFARVRAHVRDVIASIAPMDSLDRYRAMGVRVITDEARFTDAATVVAGGQTIKARRFVLATGSRPMIPDIPGLEGVSYLTNETLFNLAEKPEHLVVIGGGATGIEIAQAYRRLGVRVTVLEAGERILAQEDPEMAAVVERALRGEGVDFRIGTAIARIERRAGGQVAVILEGEGNETLEGSHLFVAAGRHPAIEGLGLDSARIDADASGIKVNQGLKTTNAKVYAIGDCASGAGGRFTHVANHHAGLVIRNALFQLPARLGSTPIPRVTYSDPELAAIGLTEEEARAKHSALRILRWSFADNDRARAERSTTGHVKAIVTSHGKVLGCTIVGARAGELIMPWNLAMAKELKISDLAGLVYPYPTLSEATKSAAVEFLKPTAQNPWVRRLVGFVSRLG